MVGDIVVGVRVRVRHDSQLGVLNSDDKDEVVWCGAAAVRG